MVFMSSGCFCVFPVPTGLIDNAISGSHCVKDTAKVGDIITNEKTGERFTITTINKTEDGTPYRGCNARFPNRAKGEPLPTETVAK
jgi:hypothetical protein